jgi:hypothetical protein
MRHRPRVLSIAALLAVCSLAVLVPQASAAKKGKGPRQGVRTTKVMKDGTRVLKFSFGPVKINPGQNDIAIDPNTVVRPKGNGWITSFAPNLIRADGSVPPVDVIHLHHAVWLVNYAPTWAAGEEKTRVSLPKGFGWRYTTSDQWLMNHMIHNLTSNKDKVWIVWTMKFVPDGTKAAQNMKQVRTQWMDVHPGIYPVFDALKGSGKNGRFTYPDDQPNAYGTRPNGQPRRQGNQWVVDHDSTIVGTAGHLHPGGLYTDLTITRNGQTRLLFRSRAHYYEPAGSVSWDVSMGATPPKWRAAVKKGDIIAVHATYDVRKASWYESMGIMPLAVTDVPRGGADPFATNLGAMKGVLTHGHLPENDNHGGTKTSAYRDPRKLPDGPAGGEVDIKDFTYSQGDLTSQGKAGRPAVVQRGQALTFRNLDAPRYIFHTVTSCASPCTRLSGIAYPLPNGAVTFDSAELGTSRSFGQPASGRDTWQTPANLSDGTYSYFCRIHPFMRGAFRVKG